MSTVLVITKSKENDGKVGVMSRFIKTILYTDDDGYAKFKQEEIALPHGDFMTQLSQNFKACQYQLRHSVVGFTSEFHCTSVPQWLFVLQGEMEIGLQDGSWYSFKAGQHFYSADVLPKGEVFNTHHHGHRSRQVGSLPLVTLFLREDTGVD